MIRIVIIEREYGSGGGEIAQQLATRLGWKLWDQLLTEEIAKLAECPKAVVRFERNEPIPSTTGCSSHFCAGAMKEALMRTSSSWWTAKVS